MLKNNLNWRTEVRPTDAEVVLFLCQSAGNFNQAEMDLAVELVQERLVKGPASGYHFLFADTDRVTVAYTCFGPIAGTMDRWDLYWIVVDEKFRGQGLGRQLLIETERLIKAAGGLRIYVETSSRRDYREARKFYQSGGYTREAVIHDFYAPGDHKVIYMKNLEGFPKFPRSERIKGLDSDPEPCKSPHSSLPNLT